MNCPNFIEDRDGEMTIPCGEDDGRQCDACTAEESAYWSRYFGQDHGTKEEKRARLMAMDPRNERTKREADFRSDAEIEAAS